MATSPNITPDPRNTTIADGKREVALTTTQVQPPTALYIQPEDSFTLTISQPTFAGANAYAVFLRWLRPDGEIVTIKKPFSITGVFTTFQFTLGEGFLLSAAITQPSVNIPEPGAVFFTLTIQRDLPEAGTSHAVLISDYLTNTHIPSWPFGRQIFPQEGPGRLRTIVGTVPAAGAEISEVVPVMTRWLLVAFRATLTTSAVANNRNIAFTIDDGSNVFFRSEGNDVITASSNGQVTLCNTGYVNPQILRASGVAPYSPMLLAAGYRIRTSTNLLDVGDFYSAPIYLVQEWVSF
jgi:hypothetical protein